MNKYENSSQCLRSESYVTSFQPLLAFTMKHIPTKLHQFLISSFRDIVCGQTQRQTDIQTPPKTIHAYSIAGAGNYAPMLHNSARS